MTVEAPQLYEIGTSAARNAIVDFTDELDAGELLTGTPTVDELDTSDLTITNESVNTAELTTYPDGPDMPAVTVAIGKAVQFHVTGALAGIAYTLRVLAATDSTPAQSIPQLIRLLGVDDT